MHKHLRGIPHSREVIDLIKKTKIKTPAHFPFSLVILSERSEREDPPRQRSKNLTVYNFILVASRVVAFIGCAAAGNFNKTAEKAKKRVD